MWRFIALLLALALPAGAPGWPRPTDDVRHAESFVRDNVHRWVHGRPSPAERDRLLLDLWAACAELGGNRAAGLFRFLVVVGWQESGLTFQSNDNRASWGPWAVQDYEVRAAADRLGRPRVEAWRDAAGQHRGSRWHRFLADRTYCVWISTEHLRWALVANGWRPREAAMAHRGGPGWGKREGAWRLWAGYVPPLLDRYERAWPDSHLPFVIDPDRPSGVAFGANPNQEVSK